MYQLYTQQPGAETYGGGGVSETILGNGLQMGFEKGTWERMDLVISTKLFSGARDWSADWSLRVDGT